ncbi:MAG: ABC transporter ATP-binding protein [Acidiferrobacteraceae bacterium]|nr:ABC transporter ATP-binding protein [Acidiferrobacteraceae bacterium]|tara:strand:- start:5041 stop:5829 length:789 start_codon:yes stop_codon:yes gene_type:complete
MVRVTDLSFGYHGRAVYRGLDLQIARGDVTAIMGPSGCGKSTLLALMGGLLMAQSGNVYFDEMDLGDRSKRQLYHLRKRMGMMFQNNALFNDLDVFENVAFPVRQNTNLPEKLIRSLVLIKLHMVGLRGTARLMPKELSGGMARRVALARALALDPQLVMYDEPFTGLDPISKDIVAKLIRELNDALGMTSIVVTQDVTEGMLVADRVIIFSNGSVVDDGRPEDISGSEKWQVREFLDGKSEGAVEFHYPAKDYLEDLFGID